MDSNVMKCLSTLQFGEMQVFEQMAVIPHVEPPQAGRLQERLLSLFPFYQQ